VPPGVLAIVLNWNSADDCFACLASLARTTYAHRVLVVDNGSSDDSVARLRAHSPPLEILELGVNRGYAAGNNRGIAWGLARGFDYFWILNPDVTVGPACLAGLVHVAEAQPRAAMVGPLVYCKESPQRLLSAGGVFRDGWTWHRGLGELDVGQFTGVTEVDYLTGCAVLIPRALVESIGALDERFFLYEEDVEWCYRARHAGLRVLLAPHAKVWHPDTRRRDDLSARVTYYTARNKLLLLRTHRLGARAVAVHLLRHARTLASWTLRPKWRHKRAQRRALLRALLDAARARWGAADGL